MGVASIVFSVIGVVVGIILIIVIIVIFVLGIGIAAAAVDSGLHVSFLICNCKLYSTLHISV